MVDDLIHQAFLQELFKVIRLFNLFNRVPRLFMICLNISYPRTYRADAFAAYYGLLHVERYSIPPLYVICATDVHVSSECQTFRQPLRCGTAWIDKIVCDGSYIRSAIM